MDAEHILRIIAFIGAIIVGICAVTSLRAEWKKTGLDDHVTKIMLILLTVGCIIVLLVATHVGGIGRV